EICIAVAPGRALRGSGKFWLQAVTRTVPVRAGTVLPGIAERAEAVFDGRFPAPLPGADRQGVTARVRGWRPRRRGSGGVAGVDLPDRWHRADRGTPEKWCSRVG